VIRSDSLTAVGPDPRVKLIWINSPSNPTGKVLPAEHLRKVVAWARERGVTVVSDECYLSLGWDTSPVSVLSDEVTGGDYTGVVAVHSLSKRSNLAGYRAGFLGGDPALIAELLTVRKHAGMIVPAPVQAAMVAALTDETHVAQQRERYAARREILRAALVKAGFEISHSEAGLYLWATRDEDCWTTVDRLARRGILAAPGAFYGPAAAKHVRIAMTATDERVAAAADRLGEPF
jgi:succinyldiaminopimelate transaminase